MSNNSVKKYRKGKKYKSMKRFLYNPDDPKKSFDVYIDKNPRDTIHIKYRTVDDVRRRFANQSDFTRIKSMHTNAYGKWE